MTQLMLLIIYEDTLILKYALYRSADGSIRGSSNGGDSGEDSKMPVHLGKYANLSE